MSDAPTVAPPDAICVVCRWSPVAAPLCGVCGWRDGGRGDAARRAAQTDWDLRAAHLAAAGRDGDLHRMLRWLRGHPDADDVDRVGVEAYAPHRKLDERWRHIADLLRAVAGQDLRRIVVATIDARGLRTHLVDTNDVGTTRVTAAGRWLWPMLEGDRLAQRFRLAGGIGRRHDRFPAEDLERLVAALPRVPEAETGSAVVVLLTEPGWALLGLAAQRLAGRWRAATTVVHSVDGNLDDFLESVIRQLPLRATYDIVFMTSNPDGSVALRPEPVFVAGAAPGGPRDIEVYAPVGPDGPVTLPVVIRDAGTSYAAWTPVSLPRLHVPRGHRGRLRLRLDAAAEVDVSPADAHVARTDDDARAWPQLLAAVPRRLFGEPADIAFLIERVGGDGRLTLARATLAALASETFHHELIRVGVVAYGQHLDAPSPAPVATWDFRSPHELAELTGLTALPNRNDYAAAVEDALADAAALHWRADARRVLVTIGCRGPYPPHPTQDRAGHCPRRIDWEKSLDALGTVSRVAVWHDPGREVPPTDRLVTDRTHRAWTELGRDGLVYSTDATVEHLMKMLGVALVDESSPLAYAGTAPG
ncbi:hypothetical protein AB0J74_32870 [Asanoa sp. NPDC049573]|uniref:hypothetical protein n=1 Tax=Asanoa sp. NPDC049573 TaxID=3155396 RepID=UPI00343E4748